MAEVRPYPQQYVSRFALPSGELATLRPVLPEDEAALAAFHRSLSVSAVHLRYFHAIGLPQRIAHARLAAICRPDFARELPLVVVREAPGGVREILGIGRLNREARPGEAELAVIVADTWQRRGIGGRLVDALVAAARTEGYARIVAWLLPENDAMRRLLAARHFSFAHDDDGGVVRGTLELP